MKKLIYAACFTTLFANVSFAQDLYVPRDVARAFAKQTRSTDGRPGKNYWQNHARYEITVTAAPPSREIKGKEHITYFNNSPDTLPYLVFKLLLNIHRPGAARSSDADSAYLTPGILVDSLSVDGKAQPWHDPRTHSTWQAVRLPTPLLPKDSVRLDIRWHYLVSVESDREGMIDSTTFYLAYFYPRVAVYDDYNGWDRMTFTDNQEFYNDFNDYSLTVNVPANYVVWATGTLQNPDEVLAPDCARKLASSMVSDDIVHIATPGDIVAKRITAQNQMNAWKWKADGVTDMALAISDHYDWDASSVVVDDATGRRASVQSAYNDTARDYHEMVSFGRHALDWLSHHWPGVAYPFPKTTVVQGYADMEYPMMVNDASAADPLFSEMVVEHEIAHSWFPFYMGINETRYGFMDEGWATTFEFLISRSDRGKEEADSFYRLFRIDQWIHDRSADEEIPIITPGDVLSGSGLGNNEYGKASLGYLAAMDLLGDNVFRHSLHTFMDRWHGKHPIPWDFFNTMNDASGADLNWFWNNWYFSNYYIDLAINHVVKGTGGYTVTLTNIGGMAAPVDVVVIYADGSSDTLHQTPAIWKANPKQAVVHIAGSRVIRSIRLWGGVFMDADESNNRWEQK